MNTKLYILDVIDNLIHQFNYRITSDKPFQMEVSRDTRTLDHLYHEYPDRWFKMMKSYLVRLRSYYENYRFFITEDQFHHLVEEFLRVIGKQDFTRNELVSSVLGQISQFTKITQARTIDFSKRGLEI